MSTTERIRKEFDFLRLFNYRGRVRLLLWRRGCTFTQFGQMNGSTTVSRLKPALVFLFTLFAEGFFFVILASFVTMPA